MNLWTLALSLPLFWGAIEIQVQTGRSLKLASDIRWEVLSSVERCPSIPNRMDCDIHVYAKRQGRWDLCDESHPPSGADLAMHRYFKVAGSCKGTIGNQTLKIPIPTQIIFR